MGKYFDGKRFNYIKTGTTELSGYAIRKLSRTGSRSSAIKNKADRGSKNFVKNFLAMCSYIKRGVLSTVNLLVVRYRKTANMDSSSKLKDKKKVSKWQNRANGVKVRFTHLFTALENRAKKLYEFLDDV